MKDYIKIKLRSVGFITTDIEGTIYAERKGFKITVKPSSFQVDVGSKRIQTKDIASLSDLISIL